MMVYRRQAPCIGVGFICLLLLGVGCESSGVLPEDPADTDADADTDTDSDVDTDSDGDSDTDGDGDSDSDSDGDGDADTDTDTDADSDADSDSDSDADTDSDSDGDVLLSMAVDPLNQLIELDLDTPGSQTYLVTGKYGDGSEKEVTDQVAFVHSNPAVGAFSLNVLEVPPFSAVSAETTQITASLDGVSALARLTVVAYEMDGDEPDFFFNLPYNDPNGEQDKPLTFSTEVPKLDAFIDMDTTSSMTGAIANVQSSLQNTVIPGVLDQVEDTWFGVGHFEDFPVGGYGGALDQPFELLQPMTDVVADIQAGVDALSLGSGADGPESLIESLYQIATGEGLDGPDPTYVAPHTIGIGGVAYRDGSMPVVIAVTDAPSHTVGEGNLSLDYAGDVASVAHDRETTKAALAEICAKVVGIASYSGLADIRDFATASGARVPPIAWGEAADRPPNCSEAHCCTGLNGAGEAVDGDGLCPLVFTMDTSGNGLDLNIVTGLKMLARFAAFDVLTETEGKTSGENGEVLPPGKTTADFIKKITPISFVKPTDPPGLPDPIITPNGFENVTPGTQVTFDIAAYNDFVVQNDNAQFFTATIRVLAGDCVPLDERQVLILVPPSNIIIE